MNIKHEPCLTIKHGLTQSTVDVDVVVKRVAKAFRITPERLKVRKQSRLVAPARRAVCWALSDAGLTNAEIARRLQRHPTTIRNSVLRARAELAADPELTARLREIVGSL